MASAGVLGVSPQSTTDGKTPSVGAKTLDAILSVLTACGQCNSAAPCQWDVADRNWFCQKCWNGLGEKGPDPTWPSPSIVCTRDQSLAAEHLRPWMARIDGGSNLGDGDGRTRGGGASLVVGFDIEWRPNFVKGEVPNRTALLQLAGRADDASVLTRLAGQRRLHDGIVALLAHPNVVLVGVGIKSDILKLVKDFSLGGGKRRRVRFADLGDVAKQLGHEGGLGMKKLAEHHGIVCAHKTRSLQMCNWEKPSLTPGEVAYGARDATIGVAIAEALRNRFGTPSESVSAFLEPFVEAVDIR